MKTKVLYVSSSCIPYNATGIRVKNLGDLIKKVNCDVVYYTMSDYKLIFKKNELDNLKIFHNETLAKVELNGDIHYFDDNRCTKKFQVIYNYLELFFNNAAFRNIVEICKKEKVNTIILYNPFYELSKKILKFCNKNNIKLIIDNTEWYEITNKKDFSNNFVAKSVNRRILKLDKKINRIISISPWMCNWYNKQNINCICIMPIMDNFHLQENSKEDNSINIIYCGAPGTKDLLIPFVDEIVKLNNNRIKLHIVGVDEKYFSIKNLQDYNIYCYGRIPREQVLKFYSIADFSCLFRKNLIYAKAGFSTKVAESLSFGVPVLCNKVGGTDDIIDSLFNGIKIEKFESEEIKAMLMKILSLNNEQIYGMKKNAYNTAVKLFDSNDYIDVIKKIIY